MLVLTPLPPNGQAAFEGGSVSSLEDAIVVTIPANALTIVRVTTGDQTGVNGASDEHALADDIGTVYTKLKEVTRITEPFRPGVTVSLWMVRKTTAIPAGTLLEASWPVATGAGAWSVSSYDPEDVDNEVELLGAAAFDHASSDGSANPVVINTPPLSDDITWIGAMAFDGDDNLVPAVPNGWAEDHPPVQNGGTNFTGMTLLGHHRSVEALDQAWEIPDTLGGRRWVMLLAAFRLVAPVVTPVDGFREFEADFDTATDGGTRVSTSLFPDAITDDFLHAFSYGPAVINDPAGGVEAKAWHAVALVDRVTIQRENAGGTGYNAATDLFTYTGAVIDYLSLAFSDSGRPVVVAQRGTGTAGAPEVWIYRWDTVAADFVWENLGLGRTPRACLDRFPEIGIHCAPVPDVQVVFLRPGPGPDAIGLVRLQENEDFAEIHATPLPSVPNIGLVEFYPDIVARTMCVRYGRRNVLSGKWELRDVVSDPYEANLLRRPFFPANEPGDIAWNEGVEFTVGAFTGQVAQLRVEVVEAVDAIQVQAESTTLDELTGWDEQIQEQTGPFIAGDSRQFPFTLDGGAGAMAPRYFRARTKKVVGGEECFSSWKYFLAGQGVGNVSAVDGAEVGHVVPVTFDTTADAELYIQYIQAGGTPAEGWHNAPVILNCQQVFDPSIGGGWVTPYRATARKREQFTFSDDEFSFDFLMLGRGFASVASASPWVPLGIRSTTQDPVQFPPNPNPL